MRRLQRQMRRRRMLKEVERATVVITNPTHFAVALEYRPEMPAPVVVAKGVNALAEQIKRVARWHEIPIAENPPLAQALYRSVEVGQAIPAKLYAAVAEILAFLYRAQMRAQQAAGRQDDRWRTASDKPKAGLGKRASEWIIPVAAVALVFVMLVPLPGLRAGSAAGHQHHRVGAGAALGGAHSAAGTVFRFSQPAAAADAVPSVAEPGQQPPNPAARQRRAPAPPGMSLRPSGSSWWAATTLSASSCSWRLIAIQYMVVSHGAVRTAEVTARFTLDAMPGKQMAIDADLNAGVIDEKQARARREQVSREAEFYGAMDGAARFNQRDSLATVLITAINIIAGFLIGVFQLDVPFREALKTYTILTVGDGLVTMIPSLLVSVAGGIVVTRSSSDNTPGYEVGKQLFCRSRPLWIAAGAMAALAMIPGLPKIPFLSIAVAAGWLARRAKREFEKPLAAPARRRLRPTEHLRAHANRRRWKAC